ncbi:uncharacterized protein LOC128346350 isoform X4 [Hemicordylus capensis]|uniref:uncharacterized protein LOC128346350 isoform X4 n=1 Tax=Hemicordylus capensis TaxID=884348 RepID=UPI00230373E4|nr:uncharacterized protein LOC128346350 isoform X4 [Hemicordylus capensis]
MDCPISSRIEKTANQRSKAKASWPRKLSRLLKPVFVEIIRLILKKNHRRSGRFSHSLRLVVRKKCCQAAEPGPSAESRTSISASPAPFLSD